MLIFCMLVCILQHELYDIIINADIGRMRQNYYLEVYVEPNLVTWLRYFLYTYRVPLYKAAEKYKNKCKFVFPTKRAGDNWNSVLISCMSFQPTNSF